MNHRWNLDAMGVRFPSNFGIIQKGLTLQCRKKKMNGSRVYLPSHNIAMKFRLAAPCQCFQFVFIFLKYLICTGK